MKKAIIILGLILLSQPVFAQEKGQSSDSTKSNIKRGPHGEIKLDALHLEAVIEKPSVAIVPKRVEPDLAEVEFIIREFDQEVKMVPKKLFDLQQEKDKTEKISDVNRVLNKQRK